jgi:RimJ/RimL family protein N-acetyltransferase
MFKLEKDAYGKLYQNYIAGDFFFPLIGAVLLDEQDGVVFVDDPSSPSQAYIEHAFGFAQIIGKPVADFEQHLKNYLLDDKLFTPAKVRLYGSYVPDFLTGHDYDSLRSWRQRFIITPNNQNIKNTSPLATDSHLTICNADKNTIEDIENTFGVVSRFWRNPDDFIRQSNAVIILLDNQPASICYSAATANHCAEIDVLTLPEYRGQGIGRLAVMQFIKQCFEQSIQPLWDCFTNNAGSMMLCKSAGFTAPREPYPFFTISK